MKRARTPRTVLLRMAEDAERAQRLKNLKAERPDLTWGDVADAVGVKERSVLEWASKGAMKYENAEAVATYLEIDLDWLWRGPQQQAPDLMTAFSAGGPQEQLDRLELMLQEVLRLLQGSGGQEPPGELGRRAGGSPPKRGGPARQSRRRVADDPRDSEQ